MNASRVLALLGKELAGPARNRPGLFWPASSPASSRSSCPYSWSSSFRRSPGSGCRTRATSSWRSRCTATSRGHASSIRRAAIQAWIFQQFLVLLVLTPVAGVDVARRLQRRSARSRRARSSRCWRRRSRTFELLAAKVLGALLPALALTLAAASRSTSRWRRSSRGPACFWCCSRRARSASCSSWGRWRRSRRCSWRCACRRASTTPAAPSRSARSSSCR